MNKDILIGASAIALAAVMGVTGVTSAEPSDPDHPVPTQIAIIYEGDVDGPMATALARCMEAVR